MKSRASTAVKPTIVAGLGVLLCLVLAGCFARYGVVRPSADIDKLFEKHQILADHRYYVDGSDLRPNAILAVADGYRLQSSLWRPVTPTQAQMRAWVEEMTRYRGYSLYTFGARMLGPDGRPVGFWYSPYQTTTVQMLDDKTVVIRTPDIPAEEEERFGFFAP